MEQNVELYNGTMVDQKTFRLLFVRLSRRLRELQEMVEEFSKTFLLKEEICPEALRMEFGQRKVELYEIEAF